MALGRLIFLGLDGLGLDMAGRLAGEGVMPNLAGLLGLGHVWALDSPLPEMSPVCWSSIFSGQEPGGHGVFGFGEFAPASYQVRPADTFSVGVPRLWDQAGAAGGRCAVLGVPLTFPAQPLNGVMISGFVTPDLARGVHPPELLPRLEAMGFRSEANLDLGREDAGALAEDLKRALVTRLEFYDQLLAEDWDLFVCVLSETDQINHFLWPALMDPGHSLAQKARDIYRLADEFLGRIWRRHGPEVESGKAALLVAADHGFGPIETEVYLNPWLAEHGYLNIAGPPGGEEILPGSQALCLDPGRIHLHWQDRFPQGRLTPGPEAEALLVRLAGDLAGLTHGLGGRPVCRVHLGRDLYAGPFAPKAPDLVLEAEPGFSLRAGLAQRRVFGKSHLTGVHRPHGALVLWLGARPEEEPGRVSELHGLMAGHMGLARARGGLA